MVLLSVNGGPAPARGLRAGDLLTYDITVTNRSGVDQSNTLTEPIPANTHAVSQPGWAISDASATRTVQIAAAGSVTVTFSVQVADPLAPNTYSIVDTVSPSTGSCSSCQVTSATSATRSYEVRMTSDVDHAIAGGVVGYRVEVRDTGLIDYTAADPAVVSVDLTGLLDDASVRSVTGHPARAGAALSWALPLAAGAAASVSFTVRVGDPDRGDRVLQASAVTPDGSGGDCPAGSPARECAPAPVGVASFTVALRADVAKVNPGEKVTYAITARNSGSVDYTSSGPARFSADLSGLVDDATYQGDATGGGTRTGDVLSWRLAIRAGETTTVTFSVLVADPDAGDHRLVDSLQTPPDSGGNCPPGPSGAGCPATVVGVQSFTVTKTSSVTSIGPGATVTFTFTVTNTGTVATSAPRVDQVTFDGSGRAPAMSRCADPAAVLAVATSWSCTATYSLTQSDIDAATLNQSAVARATTAFGSAVESNDSVARLTAPPRLTVTMTTVTTDVNGDGLIDTGDRIDWLITVSNSGGSAATGLRVSDGLGGAGSCGDSALAAGAATSCEVATYTITAADLDTTVKNTAVVMGLDIAGVRVSSKQVSVAVAVARSRPASAGSVLTGSNSTLLLIVIGTFLAAVGLLGLAGLRGGRPVPPAS